MISFIRLYLCLGLGTIGSIIGIGSGVSNLVGGSGAGNTNSQTGQYIPSGQGSADTIWQQLLGQGSGASQGASGAINPQLMQAFSQMISQIPQIQQQYGGLAGQAAGGAGQLQNQAGTLAGAGNTLWNTASDPQSALYQQGLQQTNDQTNAATSQRGIGMGAQAAGIQNQADQNYNIAWQNQQLGRQAQGLSGLESAYQGAGQDLTGGLTMGSLAPGFLTTGAQLPFGAANAYSGAQSGSNLLDSGFLSQIIPYLNYGQGASGNAFGQQQTGLNNLTSGLGQLGTLFSGGGSGGFPQFNNSNQGSNWSGNANPDPYYTPN
jgi:hypothetical protein